VEIDRPSIARKSVGSGLGLLVRHLGAVGGAAALALAGVLAFAAVVAGLATALTLAGVLAFTGVLFFYFLAGGLVCTVILGGHSGLDARQQIGSLDACAGACEQARDSRAGDEQLIRLSHMLKNPHRFEI
jgi:hypothetical protein